MKTKTETNRSPLGFPSGSFPERPARRETGYWRWGSDNLFPNALATMSRLSTTHRRIINDKADYVSGKGFVCDRESPALAGLVERANGCGESLRQVFNKVAFDKALFGNAFLEAATDAQGSFLALFHQDASRCRIARDDRHAILHHDWAAYNTRQARQLPLYPLFEPAEDGTLRSLIHYKDYEPMFDGDYAEGMLVELRLSGRFPRRRRNRFR